MPAFGSTQRKIIEDSKTKPVFTIHDMYRYYPNSRTAVRRFDALVTEGFLEKGQRRDNKEIIYMSKHITSDKYKVHNPREGINMDEPIKKESSPAEEAPATSTETAESTSEESSTVEKSDSESSEDESKEKESEEAPESAAEKAVATHETKTTWQEVLNEYRMKGQPAQYRNRDVVVKAAIACIDTHDKDAFIEHMEGILVFPEILYHIMNYMNE